MKISIISFPQPFMEKQPSHVSMTHQGKCWRFFVVPRVYEIGGDLAVELIDADDGEPYTFVSVNLPGIPLAADEFVFKAYSENEGLLEAMLAAGVVEVSGPVVMGPHAEIGPICRLLLASRRS